MKAQEIIETIQALCEDAQADLDAAREVLVRATARDARADTPRTADEVECAVWACEEAEAALKAAQAAYYAALDVLELEE